MASKVIPFNRIKKVDILNIKGGMTAASVMSKYKPDILINLALYDTKTMQNITNLVDNNVASGYLFSETGLGIVEDRKMIWTTFSKAKSDSNIKDFVAGSPVLVQNGVRKLDWGNKYSSYVDGTHKRSCVGFNDSNLVLFCSDGTMSLNRTADYCINSLGAKYMINCDGGGSCHFQVGSKIYSKSTRANCSWLLIYLLGENEMIVEVDGKEYVFQSFVKDGRTYVQLRDFEKAGYKIGYVDGVPTIEKP